MLHRLLRKGNIGQLLQQFSRPMRTCSAAARRVDVARSSSRMHRSRAVTAAHPVRPSRASVPGTSTCMAATEPCARGGIADVDHAESITAARNLVHKQEQCVHLFADQ